MSSKPSPGARIAAALRRFPIYVDPSYASALPAADRRRLAARLKKMPVPTFIVLVPLVWGLVRRTEGLPMFGAPTVAELEGERRRQRSSVSRK